MFLITPNSDMRYTTASQSNLFLTIAVTIFCFCITYLAFGFYYVEYEGLNTSFFTGKLTPGLSFRALYFSGNLGISFFYSFLYETFPNVEWLSWLYYSYLFFSCFIGLYLIAVLLPIHTSATMKVAIQIIVYYLVFADHHIHYIYTRVSYMVCGISLIGLVVFFDSSIKIKSQWRLFLLLNLFFVIGTLTRNEAAIACFLLLSVFAVFYLQNIKQCFILFSFPFLIIASLSLVLTFDIKTATDNEFYKQVEPDIEEQFIGRENRAPLSFMKTHRDTVLYNTAMEMVWSDPQIISAKFLRSLILPEKMMFTDAKQWNRVYRGFFEITMKYWYLVLVTLLLSLALFVQYNFQTTLFSRLSFFAFAGSFWVLTIVQIYTDKVNERSFLPFISLFIFCHVVLIFRNIQTNFSKWLYALFAGCFIFFCIQVYYLKKEANILLSDLLKYQNNLEKIKYVASNRYLVLNSTSFDYLFLSNTPFHPFDFSAFKKIYITDGYIIPFLPYYKRYLEKECDCNIYAFPSFWNYLKTIRTDVVIVSTPYRIKIVKDYLKEIHQFQLPVVEENSMQLSEQRKSDNRDNPDEMKIYVFEK